MATTSPDPLTAILEQAFGDKLDAGSLARLTIQAKAGAMPMPRNVQLVAAETLGGANAAYSPSDGGTIYLNQRMQAGGVRCSAAPSVYLVGLGVSGLGVSVGGLPILC